MVFLSLEPLKDSPMKKKTLFLLSFCYALQAQAFFFQKPIATEEKVLAKCGETFHLGEIRSNLNDRESGFRYFVSFEDSQINEICRLKLYANTMTRQLYGEPMAQYRSVNEYFYQNIDARFFYRFKIGDTVKLKMNNEIINAEVLDLSDKGLIQLSTGNSSDAAFYAIDDLVRKKRIVRD